MTVRRLYVPGERLVGMTVTLERELAHYLREVLRLGPGDALQVFDGAGRVREARVAKSAPGAVVLVLGEAREAAPPLADVALVQGIGKGEKMDWVVQKATELGAARILPAACERSVVRLDARRAADRAARWRRIALEAARQCGRADVPAVEEILPFAEAVAALAARDGLKLCCDEAERRRGLREVLAAAGGARRFAVAVGPEGGLSRAEVEAAARAGFAPVTLGPRVLRTETAALAVLAIVQHVAGDLG